MTAFFSRVKKRSDGASEVRTRPSNFRTSLMMGSFTCRPGLMSSLTTRPNSSKIARSSSVTTYSEFIPRSPSNTRTKPTTKDRLPISVSPFCCYFQSNYHSSPHYCYRSGALLTPCLPCFVPESYQEVDTRYCYHPLHQSSPW